MSLKTNFGYRSIILSTKFSEGLKKSPKENMSEKKKTYFFFENLNLVVLQGRTMLCMNRAKSQSTGCPTKHDS